jgi:hypothetical protein
MRSERARDSQIFVEIDSVDLNEMFLNLDVVRFPPGVSFGTSTTSSSSETCACAVSPKDEATEHPTTKRTSLLFVRINHSLLVDLAREVRKGTQFQEERRIAIGSSRMFSFRKKTLDTEHNHNLFVFP